MSIVKNIMVYETTDDYTLRGKTGWAQLPGKNIGWFVGYIELDENTYFFATNIETEKAGPDFPASRIDITKSILKELSLLH
jgi:beta-lactamase class D